MSKPNFDNLTSVLATNYKITAEAPVAKLLRDDLMQITSTFNLNTRSPDDNIQIIITLSFDDTQLKMELMKLNPQVSIDLLPFLFELHYNEICPLIASSNYTDFAKLLFEKRGECIAKRTGI